LNSCSQQRWRAARTRAQAASAPGKEMLRKPYLDSGATTPCDCRPRAAWAPEARRPSAEPTPPTATQTPLSLPSRLLISRGDSSFADVYFVDAHGHDSRQLTTGPGIKDPVAASPDGTMLAYRVEPARG
jgi:hypothetical protein